MDVRFGFGVDAHRFEKGRPLWLAGVEVPHEHGLEGHSDADVALHALADALLGAAALGDLGSHFPSSDETWRGADSADLVREVRRLLLENGWVTNNVDVTIVAQEPRLSPFVAAMRDRVASVLELPLGSVSVKATTTDHLGAVGRREGIVAFAVASVVPKMTGRAG